MAVAKSPASSLSPLPNHIKAGKYSSNAAYFSPRMHYTRMRLR